MSGATVGKRGMVLGHPSAAALFGVLAALALISLGWDYLPRGDAGSNSSGLQVTGNPTRLYVATDANIRDRATSKGSSIVGKLLPGTVVEGIVQTGESGGYLWLRLNDGSGFVSIVNLSDVAPGVPSTSDVSAIASAGSPAGNISERAGGSFIDPSEYCAAAGTTDGPPDIRYNGPEKVAWIERAIGFRQDHGYVKWGCDQGTVVACINSGITGPCEKVDINRTPHDGLVNYCRENPNSEVPMAASGHYTAFDWACRNGNPVIRGQLTHPDHRGYAPGDYAKVS